MYSRAYNIYQGVTDFVYKAASVTYGGISSMVSGGVTILSPIVSPIYAQLERFAVGDLREFYNDPTFKKKLMESARQSSSGLTIHPFGWFGGNIVVVIPQSQKQFDYLLNTFDSQPKGRSSRESLQYFSGSNRFIISNTDAGALHQRQELGGFLKPSLFTDTLIAETLKEFSAEAKVTEEKMGSKPVRKTFSLLTRNIMLKVLMGVETLPTGTYETMQGYAEDSKKWSAFPIPSLFKKLPSSQEHRKKYKALGQTILQGLLENIMYALKNNPSPEKINIVFATLINLIKEKHPKLKTQAQLSEYLQNISESEVQEYLRHDALTVIPYLLRAADNLTESLKVFLIELAKDPAKADQLSNEIKDAKIELAKDQIQWDVLKKLPYLDAWYKECLRIDGSSSVSRYAEFKTPLTDNKNETKVIPANSMVLFDMLAIKRGKHWEAPDQFMPERFLGKEFKMHQYPLIFFSGGDRKCPASFVVEYIFKLIAMHTVKNFKVELTCTEKDKEQFTLKPRQLKSELVPESFYKLTRGY